MVEVSFNVSNADVAALRSYIKDQKAALAPALGASTVSPRTNRATLVWVLLGEMDSQLARHQQKIKKPKVREYRGQRG